MALLQLQGVDPQKCAQRNRIDALRFGVSTASLSLSTQVDLPLNFARGWSPRTEEEAVARINALKPKGAPDVTPDDVILLPPMHAANNSFIRDRFMFLGSSTLRNIRRQSEQGFAFMNSHRTGMAISTPTELPLGRTYAGTYERFQGGGPGGLDAERTNLWVYMTRGVYPNGQSGPSTDDLARMITTGTLPYVSMGLHDGRAMCDVCGRNLKDKDCGHAPGTERGMDREQRSRQKGRGVTDGLASTTYEDGQPHEVSGVYAGAIDGAGFAKGWYYANTGGFTSRELDQFLSAYADLVPQGEKFMADNQSYTIKNTTGTTSGTLFVPTTGQTFQADRNWDEADTGVEGSSLPLKESEQGEDFLTEPQTSQASFTLTIADPLVETQPLRNEQAAELARERARVAELERKLAEQEVLNRQRLEASYERDAELMARQLVDDGYVLPSGRAGLVAFARALHQLCDDYPMKVAFMDNSGRSHDLTLVGALQYVLTETNQHSLLSDHTDKHIPEDAALLRSQAVEHDDVLTPEDREALRKMRDKRDDKR